MKTSIATICLLTAALFLAGCNGSLDDLAPTSAKAERRLPASLVQSMRAKGMSVTAPIMVRIFKEESVLEVWKRKDNGRYDLAASYEICKWSGKLGPKFTEGDRQAPEGFYMVRPHQMNPRSSYHLSFNMGFPNAYDRANGRTGQHLMVHGACSSAGCYSMNDGPMELIYAFARDAFRGGQEAFQIQAFPFRMTAANMARYRDDPNYEFWKMLKEGYDHFEITKVPPQVDVCGRRYVFNRIPEPGTGFSPTAACPATTQPESLQVAYRSYQASYEAAFNAAIGNGGRNATPSPTIAGTQEAALVADWSRRRARGERVTREPPSLQRPEIMMAEQRPTQEALPQALALVPEHSPMRLNAGASLAAAPAAVAPTSRLGGLFARRAEAAPAPAVEPAPSAPPVPEEAALAAPQPAFAPSDTAVATEPEIAADAAPVPQPEAAPAPARSGLGGRLRGLFGG